MRNALTHQLGHSDHDFAKFLFSLEEKYDKIILLGDIFEIEMETKLSDKETFLLCQKEHRTITKRFSSKKYIYVFGNHDLVGSKFGAVPSVEIEYQNVKYLFMHGHQFDRIYQGSGAKLSFWGGLCLKLNLKFLYKYVSEDVELGSFSIRKENEMFEMKAIEYAKSRGNHVIVTGHTHNPKIMPGEVTYINSGTCTYNRLCYVHMELENKDYKIISKVSSKL